MIDLSATVKCPHCGQKVSIPCDDLVVDTTGYEREMGTETEYSIECDAYSCPRCGKDLVLHGSIWEYPEGIENENTVAAE